jgi:hypothetical protein
MGAPAADSSVPDGAGNASGTVSQQRSLTLPSPAPAQGEADRTGGQGGDGQALSVLQILGSIAAPITVATALLYYFGWVRAQSLYGSFGVNVALLDFTTADYLLRSITPMFLPLMVGALAAVLILRAHPPIRDALRRWGEPAFTAAPQLLTVVGLIVIVWSAAVIRDYSRLPRSQIQVAPYVLAPLGLGVGLGLVLWGRYLRRELRHAVQPSSLGRPFSWSRVAQIALVGVLVALSIVWTVANYADATGTGTADRIAHNPASQPGVIVYSRQRLHIRTAGVVEQRLPASHDSHRYRYVGLRLLVVNGDSLFLISNDWTQSRTTVLLPRSDGNIRVELFKGQAPP